MSNKNEAAGWRAGGTGIDAGLGELSRQSNHNTKPRHGQIRGATWVKHVRKSVHMLRLPRQAWAVDLDDLLAAERCCVKTLELRELETNTTYRVSLETLKLRGQVIDRGFGKQVMLPLGYWRVDGPSEASEPAVVQLGLFAEAAT